MAEGRAALWQLHLGPDFPGFRVFTYAAGTTTHQDVWRDPDKLNAITGPPPMPGDDPIPAVAGADGWISFYGDGDYRLDITDRDGVLLKTFDPIRITDDVATAWEGSHGTTLPAATDNNKWHLFSKHDSSDVFDGLYLSDGVVYRNINTLGEFNVKDFGAIGDGVADDTIAIQNTVNAAEVAGGKVRAPAGIYIITSTILVTGAPLSLDGANHRGRISIVGDGSSATIFKLGSAWISGDTVIQFGATSNSASVSLKQSSIEGLFLDGDTKDADMIVMDWCQRCVVRDVLVKDSTGNGIHINKGFDNHFYETFVDSCGGDGTHFALLIDSDDATTNVNNCWFFGCRFENFETDPGGGLIKIDGSTMNTRSKDHRFIGCKFHGLPTDAQRVDRPHILLESCTAIEFHACGCQQTSGEFIEFSNTDQCKIIGGRYEGNSTATNLFNFINGDQITIDGATLNAPINAIFNMDANSANITVGPTCRFGANDAIVGGVTTGIWIAQQNENVATELTVSTGAITILPYRNFYRVDTENNDAADDLDTINGGQIGQVIILESAATARVITVTQNGNIILPGSSFVLDNAADTIMLIFQGNNWLGVSSSNN